MQNQQKKTREHYIHRLSYTTQERIAGSFVLIAVGLLVWLLITSQKTQNIFEDQITLYGTMTDIQAVDTDTNVIISGLNVGTVTDVNIDDENHVVISMSILKKYQKLIRTDSVAELLNFKFALLGKSVIETKSRLLYCRDGTVHAVQHTAAPIRNQAGGIKGLVVVFHDMTQARALERQLTYQAKHDGLTGLINRREFETRLGAIIDKLDDGPAQHLLCYLDLDQFKLVNDVCGHAAGDALLRQIAGLLKRGLRSSDTLARLGGDEFGVILANCSIDRGIEMAEGMRERVRDFRFSWGGKQFAVGASVGLVPLSRSLGNLADALGRADAACYAAKDTGRNRVHVYDPDDRELSLRKGQMKWVSRIQRALDEDRFRLYFQTIAPVDQATGDTGYFEVLLRMQGDDGKDIPPGAFIPAAERYGLMPEIDDWVVRHTLSWLAEYGGSGGHDIHRCSINLSGATLGNDKHTDRIRKTLFDRPIDPEIICFEITETAAMANLEQARHFIAELKQTGCHFALDDFGSGLSSFGYLKDLDVDFVKIDGAFIKEIERQKVDRAMVEAITGIAAVMGLKTIAEFVENEAALAVLREIGVDYAQGYHIARPKPLSDYPGRAQAEAQGPGAAVALSEPRRLSSGP